MTSLNNLECVTLFVGDLARTRAFYEAVFDARPIYSDAVCSVIGLGGVMTPTVLTGSSTAKACQISS